MNQRLGVLGWVAFVIAMGVSTRTGQGARLSVTYPAEAWAAGTCSLAPLVCANDTSPGCEILCDGEKMPACSEGSCSPAGNIVAPNHCACK